MEGGGGDTISGQPDGVGDRDDISGDGTCGEGAVTETAAGDRKDG